MKNRIGVIGGGQLARMMGEPAKRLGFTMVVLDPTPSSPAGQVVDYQIVGNYEDEAAIAALGEQADFVTFEAEVANWAALDALSAQVNPPASTLEIMVNKLKQKQLLQKLGVATPDFREVVDATGIMEAAAELGYPLMLKAAVNAYDGRGNFLISGADDVAAALDKLGGQVLYVEKFVPFAKELAIMVARNTKGEIATHPLVENIHHNHILHETLAPAPVDKDVFEKAKEFATTVVQQLEGAGIFGIEMFLTKDNEVLINEIAPRVHNSGHYTIEACKTSQFEQHIRAITGLPLASTEMVVPAAVMINILGDRSGQAQVDGLTRAQKISGVSVHIYGKTDTRPERKMGHITAVANTLDEALVNARAARALIRI
jgi:5-(carboxyamino)imidazole ribonucleotide synthase